MKKSLQAILLGLTLLLLGAMNAQAQTTITVSGSCFNGSAVLNENGTDGGKPYFDGTGNAGGGPVNISIAWNIGLNSWILRLGVQGAFEYLGDTPKPPNNQTGAWVKVTNSACPAGGTTLVVMGSGTQSLGSSSPTITSFTPTNGPVGTSITVTGTNLDGATAASVNGTAGTIVGTPTTTSVTFTVGAGSTTGAVSVVTPGGTATGGSFTVQTGPQTRYANAARPDDNGDGLTWATAHKYLQSALTAAQSGDQIWVAQGTYKPTTSTTDQEASFFMKENVKIYGGFTSGQMNLTDRNSNPATNGTVLSGDINNDNALAGNSYHVIYNNNNGLTAAALLDGFTITGGNADVTGLFRENGGGMLNYSSSPALTNCSFQNNNAYYAGGMYNDSSSPALTNCSFQNNTASYGGGMYNFTSSTPTLTNCSFQNNTATYAGGMYNKSSSPALTNCSFQNNTASYGGGMYNYSSSSPALINCSFLNNNAVGYGSGGGIFNLGNCNPTLTNCSFQNNNAGQNGGGMYNSGSSPTLTNCSFLNNNAVDYGSGGGCTITEAVVLR